MARKRLSEEEEAVLASLDASPTPEEITANVTALPPTIVATAPVVQRRRYRVLKDVTFSFFGQITSFRMGDVIEEAGYGAEGITRLLDSGVPLEEVA